MMNLNHNNTHIRRTPIPTDMLLNPHLSNDAKAAAAILYTCDESQWILAEMARELHMTEETLSKIFWSCT